METWGDHEGGETGREHRQGGSGGAQESGSGLSRLLCTLQSVAYPVGPEAPRPLPLVDVTLAQDGALHDLRVPGRRPQVQAVRRSVGEGGKRADGRLVHPGVQRGHDGGPAELPGKRAGLEAIAEELHQVVQVALL